MNQKRLLIYIFCSFSALFADEIRSQSGSLIKGSIRAVTESQIVIETDFAGTLRVDRDQVAGFSSDDPVFARLTADAVRSDAEQSSAAAESSKKSVAPLCDKIPEIPLRNWNYQMVTQLSGKSGNSEEKAMGMDLSAVLAGKQDELKLYGSYNLKESNGQKSSDERQIGARYTSYFSDPWGWYIRQEFDEDQFKNIQLRSISAVGFSYRKIEDQEKRMGFNAGVSYRHEVYVEDSPDSSNLGLDLGFENFFGASRRFEIHNEFSLVPSIEDMSSYLFTQNSYMDVPLTGSKRWKIRLGLRNDLNSQPTADRKRLDSSYYSSLVANWD